jgi:hypothetical protein
MLHNHNFKTGPGPRFAASSSNASSTTLLHRESATGGMQKFPPQALLLRDSSIVLEHRDAMPRPTTFNESGLTIEAVIASTTPVRRADSKGAFWEVLDPAGLDLDVTRGSSVLDSHVRGGVAAIIGKLDDAWVEGDEVIARIRFSERAEVASIIADVRSGIISFLSVGYEVSAWTDGKNAKGERTRTATAWAAREASFVSVPADPKARTRSNVSPGETFADRAITNRSIRVLGREAGLSLSAIDGLIDAGATVEETRMAVLNNIVNRGSVIIRATGHNANSLDNPEVFQRAAMEGLYVRLDASYKPAAQGSQFVGWSQADLARECLTRAGVGTQGMQGQTLITRALNSTSDYPNILAAIMDKSMRVAYGAQPSGIKRIAKEATANDFRARSRVQFDSSGFALRKVSETGEFMYSAFVDSAESYAVDSYGALFGISRKALINDDLGIFADITRRTGMAAAEFERQFLVTLLTTTTLGPLMSDGIALFNETHGNLNSVAAAPSVTSLAAARLLMRGQTGPGGGLISVTPKYLVVPSALETLGEQTITAIQATKTSDTNPFSFLELVVEPRLTDAARWYLWADPAQIDGLEFAYLAGAPGPQTESKAGFEVDGVTVKVRVDFGGGFIDWRAMNTNAGE